MSTAPTAPTPAPTAAPDWAGPRKVAALAAVAGVAAFAAAAVITYGTAEDGHGPGGTTRILAAYLSAWVYWLSLPLGGMALLMIHYLAKTSWGVLLRRPLESATRTLPLMAVLFVPVVIGAFVQKDSHAPLYWWSAPEHTHAADHPPASQPGDHADAGAATIAAKQAERRKMSDDAVKKRVAEEQRERYDATFSFLSPPAFAGVAVVLFAVWGAFIYVLNKWGQDGETDPAKLPASLEKLKNVSGPGLIAYAITLTVGASQWVMSLEPAWASTMFPVIFAVNQLLTCFAFCVATFLFLVARPPFRDLMRPKFQLDMGTLMLAFTLFWSYTSFSQLLIIWIGNLPEEIPFYLRRSGGGWWWVSAGLIVFHFALPFLLLLFRDIKLHPVRLRAMAIYLLVMCAVDVVWWVEPTFEGYSAASLLLDVGALLGIGGVWGLLFLYHLKQRPLFPANEAYQLPEGHHHESH